MLGLHCPFESLVVVSRGHFPVAGCGRLTAVASLVSEHGLQGTQAQELQVGGSVLGDPGLRLSSYGMQA